MACRGADGAYPPLRKRGIFPLAEERLIPVGQRKLMSTLRAGDLLGFSGSGWLSAGINLLSYGIPYWDIAHVGIVAEISDDVFPVWCGPHVDCNVGRYTRPGLYLFESTIDHDISCKLCPGVTSGVQAHYPSDSVSRSRGKVWHYPLWRELRPLESRRLTRFLIHRLGTPYDTIGAFRSAGRGFSWLESLLRKEDLSGLFCSELCAAAHRHINLLATENISRWNPNRLLRTERKQGILRKPGRVK